MRWNCDAVSTHLSEFNSASSTLGWLAGLTVFLMAAEVHCVLFSSGLPCAADLWLPLTHLQTKVTLARCSPTIQNLPRHHNVKSLYHALSLHQCGIFHVAYREASPNRVVSTPLLCESSRCTPFRLAFCNNFGLLCRKCKWTSVSYGCADISAVRNFWLKSSSWNNAWEMAEQFLHSVVFLLSQWAIHTQPTKPSHIPVSEKMFLLHFDDVCNHESSCDFAVSDKTLKGAQAAQGEIC